MTTKTQKFVTDFTLEEFGKVYQANEKLRNDIYSDMVETEQFYISDMLDCFKDSLRNWSIGDYGHNFISVRQEIEEYRKFVDGVKKAQNDFCMLGDEDNIFIEKLDKKIERFYNMDCDNKQYENIEKSIENDVELLADKIAENFTLIFRSLLDDETAIDYFATFYAAERLDGKAYILEEDNDYKLYLDVSYTKQF